VAPRVLVCDDATGIRLVMRTALEDAGLETITPAGCWEDAVAAAAAERPDAIVTDLWMPTYQPEMLSQLCAASPDSLIFVLSVMPVDQARREIEGVAEVAGVFSKPDPPAIIAARVRDALAAKGLAV
jgi:DNA-binding NarL/FixJ family response regulator